MIASPASALLGLGDRTVVWREEVTLRTGQPLRVDRSVTFGADEWFRPGRGALKKQTLSFTHAGRTVEWENLHGYAEIPAILDIVDGAPVLVIPVGGWETCQRHGFPRDGLAAWREEKGKWLRNDAERLPADLRVNLLGSFGDLMREPPAKGVVVNAAWKESRGAEREGATLPALSKRLVEREGSCARLRPAPDPAFEAAERRVAQAQKSAPTVVATRTAMSATPEQVSAADARAALGRWVHAIWVAESCASVVKQVENTYGPAADAAGARPRSTGYTIHVATPAGNARLGLPGTELSLASIACGNASIVVARRSSADKMLIARFDRAGAPVDATWVQLPGASEAAVEANAWPTLWSLTLSGESILAVVLADYVYAGTMGQAGTLRRKATYRVELPRAH